MIPIGVDIVYHSLSISRFGITDYPCLCVSQDTAIGLLTTHPSGQQLTVIVFVQYAGYLLSHVGKADADKTREVTGYAIGGVPPLGHATKMKILIDETFKKFDEIWAAAGHPHFVFPTTYEELVRLSGAIPADVALKG